MNAFMNSLTDILRKYGRILIIRRSAYLLALALFALGDFILTPRSARTFEFVSLLDDRPTVERRFVPRRFGLEASLETYVAEYLLGPTVVESAYLFLKGSRVESVLVRDGVAHIGISQDAAFPSEPGLDVRDSMNILISGIRRNFPNLKRVMVYIGGFEPYASDYLGTRLAAELPKKGKSVDK